MLANLENSMVVTGLEKVSFHSNPKEGQCQKMFRLLQNCIHFICYQSNSQICKARLQQYVNWELPNIQVGFRKGRGIRDQIANIHWMVEKENSRKTSPSASLTMLKPLTVYITTSCGKFLSDGNIRHLTCLLWNLHAGQEATVRTRHGTTDWFQIEKGICQGCILLPSLFNLYAEQSSVQFSHSVTFNFLQLHGLQHTRPPCPSPAPGVCSDSCPSSWWCHLTISSLLSPSPPAFNHSQQQGFSQWVSFSPILSWPKYWNLSISLSNELLGLISFRMDWLGLLAIQGTLKSLFQHHSSKASTCQHSGFFTVQLSHPYMTTGKGTVLTRWICRVHYVKCWAGCSTSWNQDCWEKNQ